MSVDNLNASYVQVVRNKGVAGIDKIGSMKGLCEKLDSSIRYRLRIVSRWAAFKIAYCGDRYTRLAHNDWVQKAISNKRLAAFGLIPMEDYYAKRRVTC